jgi:hypothetical protein
MLHVTGSPSAIVEEGVRFHGGAEALGKRERLAAARVGEQDREFLAPIAREDVERREQVVANEPRHLLQDVIARIVAERVVDPLEVVEVEEDQRKVDVQRRARLNSAESASMK